LLDWHPGVILDDNPIAGGPVIAKIERHAGPRNHADVLDVEQHLSAFASRETDRRVQVGEVVGVRRAPIRFDVDKGKGTFDVGEVCRAELEPFLGPTGKPTTLTESIFSTVPGSPAYVGKASSYRQAPELNHNINLQGHNAILSNFVFDHRAAA
jgi:hypothetical protein